MGVIRAMGQQQQQQPVLALFNVSMIGHVNPTFPLVVELVRRGCKVHYFLEPNEDIRIAARDAGAVVEAYVEDDAADFALETCGVSEANGVADSERALWERAVWPLASTLISGEHIIRRCRDLGVQAVLYDPMAPHGLLVAEALAVPCMSLVTYPGMGSLADLMNNAEALERMRDIRREYGLKIREKFGVDLQDQMITRRQYYSQKNLVTTASDLVVPLPPAGEACWADELRNNFQFHAVGCMVSETAPHVTGSKKCQAGAGPSIDLGRTLPVGELEAAKASGAKIIYAALGTMALADRWAKDLGMASAGNLPMGTTGKEYCHHVWRALLAAMRRLGEGYHCVLCVGTQSDAMDFLDAASGEQLSNNVTVRSSVPQVEMLRSYADVFVSHMGFNSLQESLFAGVPLIAVPQAVDQPANAARAAASGWAQAFPRPMASVTAGGLEAAVREVTAEGSAYRAAVVASSAQLRGGELRAADCLVEMAAAGAASAASAAASAAASSATARR